MSDKQVQAPPTTGSIGQQVEIQGPLPPTLAYSDASKIGQTAADALASVAAEPSAEWINASTGSSGTFIPAQSAAGEDPSRACRLFNTIVTSFRGVHQYNGRICPDADGRAVVSLEEPAIAGEPLPAAEPAAAEAAALY